ncbi:hypothetical protein ARAM_004447 [Aspergillus rambellii]|uniref:Uncharacterized protein n=1 Tax=Aspergillus rambellii TaxID=308745 RepID=A0A0F8WNU9_9EURO|nr:hypothetical protein ARAM_004447 [Aspergillus rambellii]
MGAFSNRRGEKEDWNSGRPRRTLGQDEVERKPRRNGEFDRWENRDPREQPFEQRGGTKDKDGRFFPRREPQPGRARHEGSWFRDDNAQEGPDAEEEKASLRNREWRRDRHGADRDWTRGAKLEQEPEWLDANEKEESRRVHTQEDFERWKEKMKAGSSQPQEEKKEIPVEAVPESLAKSESRPSDGEIFSANGSALQDSTMERFFGLLGDSKPSQEIHAPPPPPIDPAVVRKEMLAGKSMKSSRFAGLFSPPLGSPAKESESPTSTKSPIFNPSFDADQEGFQRILQMLGGGRSQNSTPNNDAALVNRPASLVQAEQTRSTLSSPSREHAQRPELILMQDAPVRGPGPALKEHIYSQDSQARDREHLLRLMQQVRVSPNGPNQGLHPQPPSTGPAPGLMNMPDTIMPPHPPGIGPGPKVPNMLDDPAIANMPRPNDQLRRRPTNGPPVGYFDDVPFPQGGQVPITPSGSRAPQGQVPPGMGIPRPPGFDHMPPPGWAGHHLPPQQGGGPGGPVAPPPGIPTPTRGINPSYIANMVPIHGNMPPMNERQPFPRGPGGAGGPGAGAFPPPPPPPPGMMPPPGYMNGPPPGGFPPMPPNGEALMGLPHGQGPFDGNPGPQGPPPSSRHLLEMFGQVGGGDARGGMVGPRQFR